MQTFKLWSHQEQALDLARRFSNLALFLPTGTGKTATMIKILEEEYNIGVQSTLILAPLSVCNQWREEFKKFSKLDNHYFKVLTGTGKDRCNKLRPFAEQRVPLIVITNYEALLMQEFYHLLLKWSPKVLVCDESHLLKNPNSKRSDKLFPLAYAAKRRFILTGTPIVNNLMDLFGQYKILNHEIFGGNFYSWRKRYFHDANIGMPKHNYFPNYIANKDTPKLFSEIIARTSIQAKKEDCIDLPPLLKIRVPVELSDKQRRLYDSMEKQFVVELDGATSIAQIALTKSLRLRQIIAGFVSDIEDIEKVSYVPENPRLKALEDILESVPNDKVIVWTDFVPTYSQILAMCERIGRKAVLITGQQTTDEKEEAKQAFTKGEANVLISNPAAGGTGLNLTEAAYSVYYTKSFNASHHEQSEARNYRAGSNQHSKVTHYHLEATRTVDEVISQVLLDKMDLGATMLAWAKKVSLDLQDRNTDSKSKEIHI